jgi:hypothetical protein
MKKLLLALSIALSTVTPTQAATIVQNNNASDLVAKLLGNNSGITVVGTPTLTGNALQSGIFTEGNVGTRLGIEEGIVLSTGSVNSVTRPYNVNNIGQSFNGAGSSLLDPFLAEGNGTLDAVTLSFDFTTTTGDLFITSYVFGSAEYPRYVNGDYNDLFGYFVNGTNVAKVPGTNQIVSINTINSGGNGLPPGGVNPSFYISNTNNARTLEYGGLTVPLAAQAVRIGSGVHNLTLVIADAGDYDFNSGVFLSGNGISATPTYGSGGSTAVPEPLGVVGTLVAGIAGLSLRRALKRGGIK